MGTAIGSWKTLAEAQKLSTTQLISGIFEQTVYKGPLTDHIPVAQFAGGTSITWNREKTVPTARFAAPGAEAVWDSEHDYDQLSCELKIVYKGELLNRFVEATYGNVNNYRTIMLRGLRKACTVTMNDKLFYGDTTYTDSLEPDGLHAWAALNTGTDRDIDEAGALDPIHIRQVLDAMSYGCDAIFVPPAIGRRLDAFVMERGNVLANASHVGVIQYRLDQFGTKVLMWDDIPIIRSDYLVLETDGTGVGSNARAKNTSGTAYSMLFVKFGNVFANDPGVCMAFGDNPTDGQTRLPGELFAYEYFSKMENYMASGHRLSAHVNLVVGSSLSVGRIYDITDAAVLAA